MKSLLSLLRESVDPQYVDLKTVDLQRMYRKYAAELFDNDMPYVPINVKRLSSLGVADGTRNKITGKLTPVGITISSKFKFTPELLRDILAHEMIHIWLYHNNIWDIHGGSGGHGYNFQEKMREINKKGFNITVKDTIAEVAGESKGMYALLIKRDGKHMIIAFKPNQYNLFMPYFDERYNDEHTGKYWETHLVFSKNPELLGLPLYRKPETTKRTIITKEFYDSLLQDAVKEAA